MTNARTSDRIAEIHGGIWERRFYNYFFEFLGIVKDISWNSDANELTKIRLYTVVSKTIFFDIFCNFGTVRYIFIKCYTFVSEMFSR